MVAGMTTTNAHTWLHEGLVLLAAHGAPAVTLDRLCERVGMTKGSFYHHFGSMPKFRARLLEHFEAEHTMAVIDAVESVTGLSARQKLERLAIEAIKDTGPDLEVAMRAWADQDPEAEAVQRRVDATRLDYLRRLCADAGHDEPDRLANLLYVVLVGGAHLKPPLAPAEKRAMCQALLRQFDPSVTGEEATS